jgi:DNA-binding SARP family transcriptional activator
MISVTNGVIFGILGPVTVGQTPSGLTIAEPRRRGVLAALLVYAGRVVSMDQLIGLVWGDVEPASARKAIQVYVSKLRHTLAGLNGVELATHGDGYRLSCPPDSVDLHVFQRLVAESRNLDDQVRRDLLHQALDMWRGVPFADTSSEGLKNWVAPALEEERLTALEEYYAAAIRVDGHAAVLGHLMASAAEHPERERLTYILMTALYGSGRRVEAAKVFDRLRWSLARSLGVRPSDATARLHQRILMKERRTKTTAALIADAAANLHTGDRDRALSTLYGARAQARDCHDRDNWELATNMILNLEVVTGSETSAPDLWDGAPGATALTPPAASR